MKKVTCIKCLGEGWITDRGVWNEDTSHTCYTCDGTGFVSIDKINIPMDEYEKEYNENYEIIGCKRYKKFKIVES
jgi:DnaJ-class molecular chaperone